MKENLKFSSPNMGKESRKLYEILYPKKGELNVITGINGHGKTNFVDFCCDNLNVEFGYKTLFLINEERKEIHFDNLSIKRFGDKIINKNGWTYLVREKEINENFFFKQKETDICFNDLILNIEKEIKKNSVDVLVLDSFNINNYEFNDENISEYGKQNKFLGELRRITRQLNVITFVLADTKFIKENTIPSCVDISGNMIFLTTCDTCISIYDNITEHIVSVEKNRNIENGRTGFVRLKYIRKNRCFEPKFNHMGLFEGLNEISKDNGRDFILPISHLEKTMHPNTNNGDSFYMSNSTQLPNAKWEINVIEGEIRSGIIMGLDSVFFNYTDYNNISIFNPIDYYVKLLTDARYKCEIVDEHDENDNLIQKIKIYLK